MRLKPASWQTSVTSTSRPGRASQTVTRSQDFPAASSDRQAVNTSRHRLSEKSAARSCTSAALIVPFKIAAQSSRSALFASDAGDTVIISTVFSAPVLRVVLPFPVANRRAPILHPRAAHLPALRGVEVHEPLSVHGVPTFPAVGRNLVNRGWGEALARTIYLLILLILLTLLSLACRLIVNRCVIQRVAFAATFSKKRFIC